MGGNVVDFRGSFIVTFRRIILFWGNLFWRLISAGQTIYDANCASCHGANLEGQFNWQKRNAEGYLPAPPHDETGHTWHHPDKMLFEFTKYGPQKFAGADYKSIMPAYESQLTDKEIWQVLAFIKSKWPDEIQKKHTEAFAQ